MRYGTNPTYLPVLGTSAVWQSFLCSTFVDVSSCSPDCGCASQCGVTLSSDRGNSWGQVDVTVQCDRRFGSYASYEGRLRGRHWAGRLVGPPFSWQALCPVSYLSTRKVRLSRHSQALMMFRLNFFCSDGLHTPDSLSVLWTMCQIQRPTRLLYLWLGPPSLQASFRRRGGGI